MADDWRNGLGDSSDQPTYTTADINGLMSPYEQAMRQARGLQGGMMEANPIEMAVGLLGPRVPLPRISSPIRAYHGSPHDFDMFSMDKIGTGEGAQAYGHGLYFAESEPVARSYRDALERPSKHLDSAKLDDLSLSPFKNYPPEGIAMAKALLEKHANNPVLAGREAEKLFLNGDDTARFAGNLLGAYTKHFEDVNKGKMYEVALHARPEQFLDWDKPLSQQTSEVAARLREVYGRGMGGAGLSPTMGKIFPKANRELSDVEGLLRNRPDASAALNDVGIPGVRYKDAGSRGTNGGTHNYSVWSPEIIEILRKYGLAGPAVVGGGVAMNGLAESPQQ